MASGIYQWINLSNGKIYVGQAKNIEERQNQHITALRSNSHINNKFQSDFNKYGESSFQFKILEICDRDKLNHLEDYYVKKYNSIYDGYNIATTTTNYHAEYQSEFVGESLPKRNKNKNGKGNIRQRKDGSWEARISNKVDNEKGKYKIKSFYGNTRDEAMNKLNEYLDDQKVGLENVSTVTLNKYIDKYLRLYKKNSIKPSSYDRLESVFENHVMNTIGNKLMSEITTDCIQGLINEKSQTLSYSSVKKIQELLAPCLEHAVLVGDMLKNPMLGVKMPNKRNMAIPTKKVDEYTNEETDALFSIIDSSYTENTKKHRYSPIFKFMLNTGIRTGEALALTWDKIDLINKTVTINSNLILVKDRDEKSDKKRKVVVSSTKTYNSERIIPLNDAAIEALNEIKRRNKKQEIRSKWVVASDNGNYITPRNFQRTFDLLADKAGIENKGMHGLRHTFGSRLLRNGVDIKIISDLLGHSDVALTYNKYIHIIKQQRVQSVQLLSAI